jgi:hypothetical protein
MAGEGPCFLRSQGHPSDGGREGERPIEHSDCGRRSETRSQLGKYYIINTYNNMYTLIYIPKRSLIKKSTSFQKKAPL